MSRAGDNSGGAILERQVLRMGVEAAEQAARGEDYRPTLVEQAQVLFAADGGAGVATWTPSTGTVQLSSCGSPPLSQEYLTKAQVFAPSHPGFSQMARLGHSATVRVSDYVDLPEFWTTECYWWMHGFCDGRYSVSAALQTGNALTFVALHRTAGDFTDVEVALLGRLQGLLAAALTFRRALDSASQRLQGAGAVAAGGVRGPAALCTDYRPTKREAEVLALAAEGWTNRQIGRRLGITERTVRKHLGNLYDQAGLRGRAAAAAWWQQRASHG